ncbi:hypothetical protein [Acidithiobacillus ferridurans]|uniref:hypothetical protein n=1 Tax=Acidithiobacillus ferridurans TaxID=1232575 RepID=UPI001C07359D|nr:hypothetical protein [Acidithiobacillus ferridurans]MBU2732024.1 hypothetical protein [Acidithiobacillus ferridurans]
MMAKQGNRSTIPPAEKGSALVLVIFIMVVLALLLAALAYITAQSNQNTAYQIASTRAYWAAQSGAEWGTYQIAPATGSAASQCFSPNPARPGIGSIPGLGGCSATVACSSASTASTTSYQITSQGTCPAGDLGPGNVPVSAIRNVIVGVTTQGNACAACATSCVVNHCGGFLGSCDNRFRSCAETCSIASNDVSKCINKFCPFFGHLFCDTNGLTTCLANSCPGSGGGGSATLNYWLENP